MNLLLDTCTLLWIFEGRETISAALRADLTDPANGVFFSDISLLEIVIKHQIGKLRLPRRPSTFLTSLARKHALDLCPHDTQTIFGLEALPLLHRDPFDRLLIAQARQHNLVLVTPDPKIHRYDVRWRW